MKVLNVFWKWIVGSILCGSVVTAFLAIGWTYRAMQRRSHKLWISRAAPDQPAADTPIPAPPALQLGDWPNWFLANRHDKHEGRLLHSLYLNTKIGIQALFNTWVVTLPACALWQFSWRFGWDNSFHKLYEQAFIGPLTGIFGIIIFIAVMFYLPMAQARQAVTGNWKAFYSYRLVRAMTRRQWGPCVVLAVAYAIASLPITILQVAPLFIYSDERFAAMTDEAFLMQLQGYYLAAALLVFPAYVAVHLLAAKVYARGVLQLIERDAPQVQFLDPAEVRALESLGLMKARPRPERHPITQAAGWTFHRVMRLGCGFAAAMIWFAFVVQIYIREFFNYHPIIGWLNQPLVHLPSITYIPLDLLTGGP